MVPTSLFGDCVVGTLSVGTLTNAHNYVCEESTHRHHKSRTVAGCLPSGLALMKKKKQD